MFELVKPAHQKRVAWCSYFLLGTGLLAPWNALITATDFFSAAFPGEHMDRLFTVLYLPMCLLMLGVLLRSPGRAVARTTVSFAAFVVIMVVVPVVNATFKEVGNELALSLTLCSCLLIGERAAGRRRALLPLTPGRECLNRSSSSRFGGAVIGLSTQFACQHVRNMVTHGGARVCSRVLLPLEPLARPTSVHIPCPSSPSFPLRATSYLDSTRRFELGFFDGLCQSAIFSDAAAVDAEMAHAVVGGTASSGLLISLLRIITKAAFPEDVAGLRASTAIYFALSAALSAACLVTHRYLLPQLPMVRQARDRLAAAATIASHRFAPLAMSDPDEGVSLIGSGSEGAAAAVDGSTVLETSQAETEPLAGDSAASDSVTLHVGSSSTNGSDSRPSQRSNSPRSKARTEQQRRQAALLAARRGRALPVQPASGRHASLFPVRRALGRIWPLAIANCLIYVVTLSIFPGFLAEDVRSVKLHLCLFPFFFLCCCLLLMMVMIMMTMMTMTTTMSTTTKMTMMIMMLMILAHIPLVSSHHAACATCCTATHFNDVASTSAATTPPSTPTTAGIATWHTRRRSPTLRSWYPVLLIAAFNLADFLGKVCPLGHVLTSHGQVLGWACVRVAFVPSFVLVAFYNPHESVTFLLTLALGATNGFLTAAAMTMAPQGLPTDEAAVAESICVFSLVTGLNIGALLGWLWLL